MNIIKFKDVINVNDALFNTYLKGKYAYWIQMRYVIPFEFISKAQYVEFEQDINRLLNWADRGECEPNPRYWDMYKSGSNLEAYVDVDKTEAANNIMPFTRQNQFATDSDITLDEIKKFRSWLASALLDFDHNDSGDQKCELYSEDFTSVLEYYANGMYDFVCKQLSKIKTDFAVSKINMSSCGCGAGTDISGLYCREGVLCDPLNIYRKSMWGAMCAMFGDLDFWCDFPQTFILEFKAYIDNILIANLPLVRSKYQSVFQDCSCQLNTEQMAMVDILRRLSKSLEHIINDDVQGNRNYISKAFQEWSSELYESMEWA